MTASTIENIVAGEFDTQRLDHASALHDKAREIAWCYHTARDEQEREKWATEACQLDQLARDMGITIELTDVSTSTAAIDEVSIIPETNTSERPSWLGRAWHLMPSLNSRSVAAVALTATTFTLYPVAAASADPQPSGSIVVASVGDLSSLGSGAPVFGSAPKKPEKVPSLDGLMGGSEVAGTPDQSESEPESSLDGLMGGEEVVGAPIESEPPLDELLPDSPETNQAEANNQPQSKNTETSKPKPKPTERKQPTAPAPKPEKETTESRYEELLSVIASHEGGTNYNAYYGNGDSTTPDFTSMSISEVLQWQANYVAQGSFSSAVGRYQFLDKTLRTLVQSQGISMNAELDEELQDQLAVDLMKQRGLDEYINGSISARQFAHNLSMEWASLPKMTGANPAASYYASDGVNRAGVSMPEIMDAVESVKPKPNPSPVKKAAPPSAERTHDNRGVKGNEPLQQAYVESVKKQIEWINGRNDQGNSASYVDRYTSRNEAWCAHFVVWNLNNIGLDVDSVEQLDGNSYFLASVSQMYKWMRSPSNDMFYVYAKDSLQNGTADYKPGDVIMFNWDNSLDGLINTSNNHVATVVGVTEDGDPIVSGGNYLETGSRRVVSRNDPAVVAIGRLIADAPTGGVKQNSAPAPKPAVKPKADTKKPPAQEHTPLADILEDLVSGASLKELGDPADEPTPEAETRPETESTPRETETEVVPETLTETESDVEAEQRKELMQAAIETTMAEVLPTAEE